MWSTEITEKFLTLKKKHAKDYWGQRIMAELEYLANMLDDLDETASTAAAEAIEKIWSIVQEEGTISRTIALETERNLAFLSSEVKKQQVILIAHAHIDMNWMWGYNETAAVVVDTVGTMLQLMKEYPQFHFSQSQASVYRVLEEHAPEMLEEVKERIKEGRWEVTASTWVENDKNMSSGEAMARHILYTKKYLSGLLDIPAEELNLDFEPDTFGHSRNVPEILTKGGVKYYYHCRGYEGDYVYRWRAADGAELLTYREPVWYNDEEAAYDGLGYVPAFCRRYQLDTAMKFFGVGDHGGGPSRKQIESYMDMQTWPLMPQIRFGTLKEYFSYLEQHRENFPIVDQELNYIFAGCYTSQARIKRANMIGENRLYDTEALGTIASAPLGKVESTGSLVSAWEKILFNQFHDILPGSGVIDTYQYALGEFQKAMATAQIEGKKAMKSICEQIDTSAFGPVGKTAGERGYGAGVGFKTGNDSGYLFGNVGRTEEGNRILVVFNTTAFRREEVIKAEIWDWDMEAADICAYDSEGNEVEVCVPDARKKYWAHEYLNIYLKASVPPLGYSCYVLKKKPSVLKGKDLSTLFVSGEGDPRLDHFSDTPLVMENELVKAVFTSDNMKLVSFVDKKSGREYIEEPAGSFEFVLENTDMGMTAWRVGKFGKVQDLNEATFVRFIGFRNTGLFDELEYEIRFGNSRLKVTVTLEKNSRILKYQVKADWREAGSKKKGIPHLHFRVPLGYMADKFRCAVPDATIDREAFEQDVPCLGMMAALTQEDAGDVIQLLANGKYGFRGYGDNMTVTLLRGSYDPDPLPDQGEHFIDLGIGISSPDEYALTENLYRFRHPLQTIATGSHEGNRGLTDSLLSIQGNFVLTAVKGAEAGDGIVIRGFNPSKEKTEAVVSVHIPAREVELVSLTEKIVNKLELHGKEVKLELAPFEVVSVKLVL